MLSTCIYVFRHGFAARIPQVLRGLLPVLCMLFPGGLTVKQAMAVERVYFPAIEPRFETGSLSWGQRQNMLVGGVPVSTLSFVSPHSAIDLASRLSNKSAVFQRVLTMPGQLILSGIKDQWHWIAVLSDDASGSSGYVSAMSATVITPPESSALIPAGLSLAFSAAGTGNGPAIGQHVHQLPGAPDVIRDRIASRLAGMGWHRISDVADLPGQWQWYRKGEKLSMLINQHGAGSLVLTQHYTGGAP